ncbi:MAG: tRNA (adenine(22)-N(1))-methyltransferase [Roseburia sp.]
MIQISNRLQEAAAMVKQGNRLADVGTDHAYVPIYLVQKGVISKAIAMDINKGPLERAEEHIANAGLGAYIETRLSDGVAALKQGEADTILIAGMGGGLVMHILEEGMEICQKTEELILQPQSELQQVRAYLRKHNFTILEERMVLEDGKYYPMMKVKYGVNEEGVTGDSHCKLEPEKVELYQVIEDKYGPLLLREQNAILWKYLKKEETLYRNIKRELEKLPASEKITKRLEEVEQELIYIKEATEWDRHFR